MQSRDKIFLLLGLTIGLLGIVVTFTLSIEAGIVTLLALNLLFLVMLILQRRQLGRIQQRTLTLLRSEHQAPVPKREHFDANKLRQDLTIDTDKLRQDLMSSNKRVIGLLQAQQINLDLLNDKMERVLKSESTR